MTHLIKLTKMSASATKVEFVGSTNLGCSCPASLNNIVNIPRIARTPVTLATFFTTIRAADAFHESDAKQLGQLLFLELHPRRQNADVLRQKIGEMLSLMNVLRAAQGKYRFIDELLFSIIRNEMKKGAAQASFGVSTPLVALSANEAGRIGRSLVMLLMSNATGEAAVDEYIWMFPALGGLDRQFNWFRSIMDAIAAELMNKVAYGVKVRAGLGSGLSMADMISDAMVILDFRRTGNTHYASLLMCTIGLNLVLQLGFAFEQTVGLQKGRAKSFLFEALAIATFTKPGLDPWKVASGAEQPVGAAMDPLTEMFINKGLEMFTEAIPGTLPELRLFACNLSLTQSSGLVLQAVVYLRSPEKSKVAKVSLLIYAMSAAMTSSSIFYDIDVAPDKRKNNRKW